MKDKDGELWSFLRLGFANDAKANAVLQLRTK